MTELGKDRCEGEELEGRRERKGNEQAGSNATTQLCMYYSLEVELCRFDKFASLCCTPFLHLSPLAFTKSA